MLRIVSEVWNTNNFNQSSDLCATSARVGLGIMKEKIKYWLVIQSKVASLGTVNWAMGMRRDIKGTNWKWHIYFQLSSVCRFPNLYFQIFHLRFRYISNQLLDIRVQPLEYNKSDTLSSQFPKWNLYFPYSPCHPLSSISSHSKNSPTIPLLCLIDLLISQYSPSQ